MWDSDGFCSYFLVTVGGLILENLFGFVHVCAAGLQRAPCFECFCSELRIEHTISPTSLLDELSWLWTGDDDDDDDSDDDSDDDDDDDDDDDADHYVADDIVVHFITFQTVEGLFCQRLSTELTALHCGALPKQSFTKEGVICNNW